MGSQQQIEQLHTERCEAESTLRSLLEKIEHGNMSADEKLAFDQAGIALERINFELRNIEDAPRTRADHVVSRLFSPSEDQFVELPLAIQQTVVGQLAVRVSHCLEFPLASAFLALLGSASAAVATAYAVQYRTGTPLPTGLYVVVEQPPSTQKSYLLSIGLRPYEKGIIAHNRRVAAFNKETEGDALPHGFLNATDATSAALDEALANCDSGRFLIASAEQSAFASLFPSEDFSSNNELLLKGYPGEYVSSLRKGRRAFNGVASGTVVLVAQPGSARRVLSASNRSGLAERFLYMSEPTLLGRRTLHDDYLAAADTEVFIRACAECVGEYSELVFGRWGADSNRAAMEPEQLHQLRASADGYSLIREQQRRIEPRLGLLARRGDMVMLSWLGKMEAHTLKVAGTLHVIECRAAGCAVPEIIPAPLIRAALDFVLVMGEHLEQVLRDNGESGDAAEVEAVMNLVTDDKRLGVRPAALKLQRRAPFRATGKMAYKAARSRIELMIESGLLMFDERGNLIPV